jgi:hypothetical protein
MLPSLPRNAFCFARFAIAMRTPRYEIKFSDAFKGAAFAKPGMKSCFKLCGKQRRSILRSCTRELPPD